MAIHLRFRYASEPDPFAARALPLVEQNHRETVVHIQMMKYEFQVIWVPLNSSGISDIMTCAWTVDRVMQLDQSSLIKAQH